MTDDIARQKHIHGQNTNNILCTFASDQRCCGKVLFPDGRSRERDLTSRVKNTLTGLHLPFFVLRLLRAMLRFKTFRAAE